VNFIDSATYHKNAQSSKISLYQLELGFRKQQMTHPYNIIVVAKVNGHRSRSQSLVM